ncbi:MAG: hypothetical protein ACI9W4_001295 [Rhodothermales bacterium]
MLPNRCGESISSRISRIEFELSQNYPNPFNPVTTVEFALPETVEVRLEVFDVLGRRVQTLVNGPMDAGYHSVQFNGERLAGRGGQLTDG